VYVAPVLARRDLDEERHVLSRLDQGSRVRELDVGVAFAGRVDRKEDGAAPVEMLGGRQGERRRLTAAGIGESLRAIFEGYRGRRGELTPDGDGKAGHARAARVAVAAWVEGAGVVASGAALRVGQYGVRRSGLAGADAAGHDVAA